MIPTPVPGDVWAVSTGSGLTQNLIKIGAILRGQPGVVNHVVGVSHRDKRGRWWGIEGRPGGVGWVDLAQYRHRPLSVADNSNVNQPRTDIQRKAITTAATSLVGTPYDWVGGIDADTLDGMGLEGLATALDVMWGWQDSSQAPGHVVCSSLYAWIYRKLGLPGPLVAGVSGERCTPADWWDFNAAQVW